QSNDIQSENPWLYIELDPKQYEELFYLLSDMSNEINEELTNYLSTILGELCIEKNQETNIIDELVHQQSQIGHMKKCLVCQISNIDNKKQVCPKCKNKLSTLAKIVDEQSKIVNATKKSSISPYIFKQRSILERYSESKANEPCTHPSFIAESRQFQVQIRKAQFVNPNADNRIFQNLGRELTLSKQMIRFSEIASMKRNEFIKATLIKKTLLGIWYPILITCDEAELQKSKGSLKKSEILSIIISLIPSLGDLDRSRFHGLLNKSCKELVNILQEVKNILAENNISVSEE
ncbi:15119_t:CDS:2, partial [Dentiscutata heterogama]